MSDRSRASSGTGQGFWIALVAVLVVAAGGLIYWRMGKTEAVAPTIADAGARVEAPPPVLEDAGPEGETAETPTPRPDADALLRRLAAGASASKQLEEWLSAPGILQRIAASVRLIAAGQSPRSVLSFIEIDGDFAVQEPKQYGGRLYIAPASYARYDGVIGSFTSIDPDYLAKSYRQLRPYLETAYAEVARPGERFDDVLTAAIQRVVSVHLPQGPIALVPKGAIYAFEDPELEALTPAEKHVIRLGPKNAEAIQTLLRRFASSAGLSIAR